MNLRLLLSRLQQAWANDPLTGFFVLAGLVGVGFMLVLMWDTYYKRYRERQREMKKENRKPAVQERSRRNSGRKM